jgi:catechol 2,3-dioxygenase-like lactoylglutathione lyase family enzyme
VSVGKLLSGGLRRTLPCAFLILQALAFPVCILVAPAIAQSVAVSRPSSASIRTPDFDETIRWYRDTLNFRLLSTQNLAQGRTAVLERGGFLLEITEADHPMPPTSSLDRETAGVMNVPVISLLVPDADEEISRLRARGVEILQTPEDALDGAYRTAEIRDNGRHRIELREPLGSPGSLNVYGR